MTRIAWDAVGARRFEAGVDRGVLYLPNGTVVPWNGLTSVSEDHSDITVEEYYLDGVKYLNNRSDTDYSGTMQALTYPDEFLPFDGIGEFAPGLQAADQSVNATFGLSYRTGLGDDLKGLDRGYKIHLLYSLTAKPSTKTFSSNTNTTTPMEFGWDIQGISKTVPGMRPTCHIVIDSTRVRSGVLVVLENALYGTAAAAATLPDPASLLALQNSVP